MNLLILALLLALPYAFIHGQLFRAYRDGRISPTFAAVGYGLSWGALPFAYAVATSSPLDLVLMGIAVFGFIAVSVTVRFVVFVNGPRN